MKNLKFPFLLVALFFFGQTVYAQVTTSAMSGNVFDGSEALPGATVVAIHVPTGTRTGTVTDNRGSFRIDNLRPGGPYTVTFSFMGYTTQEHRDVTLTLGDVFVMNVQLVEDAYSLNEVVIVGMAGPSNMSSERAGAITNITAQDIALMPSVNRSINDMLRLTPQASGQSIGGGNFRQNFITIDGASFNNMFGIGQNLPADGSPISIDALEQISVSLTPYDVRQTGFIGAAINAVTRSGTNEFRGSAYHFRTDERLIGNRVEDVRFTNAPSETKTYGFTFGGPIIKDKLFFFVNFENENTVLPGPARVPSTNGVANAGANIARPTAAELNAISAYLRDTHRYETGIFQGYSFNAPGQKLLARLDWNINDDHKVNVRYSYTSRKSYSPPSTSSSPWPANEFVGNRQSMSAIWFENSGYFQERNFSSLSSELNSRFLNGRLNNMLRVTWSYQDEPRSVPGGNRDFPFVDIRKDGEFFTSFGTELFSFGNLRQVNSLNITDEIMYRIGSHNITLGVSYETSTIKNGFMRFGTGHYVFDSWDDFIGGGLPSHYSITFSNNPGYEQAFPSFKFEQLSFYLQN